MANVTESSTWAAGIYQLELTDPVAGGPTGLANRQARELGNRTRWLRDHGVLANEARTISVTHTFSAAQALDGGITVGGQQVLTGTRFLNNITGISATYLNAGHSGMLNARVTARRAPGLEYFARIVNQNATRDWGIWVDDTAVDDGTFAIRDITAGPVTRFRINTNGDVLIGNSKAFGARNGANTGDVALLSTDAGNVTHVNCQGAALRLDNVSNSNAGLGAYVGFLRVNIGGTVFGIPYHANV